LSEGSGKNKPLHEDIAWIAPFRVLMICEGGRRRMGYSNAEMLLAAESYPDF
jgi:uncharacterized protein (DUF302 family)